MLVVNAHRSRGVRRSDGLVCRPRDHRDGHRDTIGPERPGGGPSGRRGRGDGHGSGGQPVSERLGAVRGQPLPGPGRGHLRVARSRRSRSALRGARLSGGLVDPTIGAAIRLLGYDRDFAAVDPDGPPLELAARPVPGWRLVTVDRDRGTIRVPDGVELDLGSTAKALAVDRAARSAWLATAPGRTQACSSASAVTSRRRNPAARRLADPCHRRPRQPDRRPWADRQHPQRRAGHIKHDGPARGSGATSSCTTSSTRARDGRRRRGGAR